jgi:hypothetical protein
MTRAKRSLIISREGSEPTELNLEPGTYLVGREDGNSLIIDHPSVAPRHCELTIFEDGALLVRNLAMDAGTSIDGVPVGVAGLGPGQRLRLGEVDCWVAGLDAAMTDEDVPLTGQRPAVGHADTPLSADAPEIPSSAPSGFWASLPGAFLFPIRGDGWIPLLMLLGVSQTSIFLPGPVQIIGLGVSLVVGAYLIQLAKAIVLATAEDPSAPFPNPEVSWDTADLRDAFATLIGLGLVCFGPAMVLQRIPTSPAWAGVVATALGCLYFPMALLAMIVTDHFTAISPTLVIPSILRAPSAYGVVVAALAFLLLGATWGNQASIPKTPGIGARFVLSVVTSAMSLYLLMVWLRLLGLFYRHHRGKLAWEG